MHKLFNRSHGCYLYTTIKTHLKNPKTYIPFSYLHTFPQNNDSNSKLAFVFNEIEHLQQSKPNSEQTLSSSRLDEPIDLVKTVQISHPWPEWVDLMECLLKRGYFDDGDDNPFERNELGSKELNRIRTACLNFARDRYGLIRQFSRLDIRVIGVCGCPSTDRKVVNSGKRLRAHVGLDEGSVCSSCNLRGDCERAFVKAREDEGGRTVDVMRILLTYGFHPISSSVENNLCLNKTVKESVRRLLNEMVKFGNKESDSDVQSATKLNTVTKDHISTVEKEGKIKVPMKPGDWNCPECKFLNFARNIRCLKCDGLFEERLSQLRADQEHLPLKKGDWICNKCYFLNFARNTKCFQCKEKPPKRELNPGEWECESCNYLNFRRNMVCLKCDHKRPKSYKAFARSVEPKYGSHPYAANLSSASDRKFQGQRNRTNDFQSFVEGESCEDNNGSDSLDDDVGFDDFPIKGGKTKLSQDVEKKEKWKAEMSKRGIRGTQDDQESSSATNERRKQLLQTASDEDKTNWLRHS
ncbi:hypothetical protein ACFE04_029251 [Oxalis oulophora]